LDHPPFTNLTIGAATVSNGQFGITHDVLCSAMPADEVNVMGIFWVAHRCTICALTPSTPLASTISTAPRSIGSRKVRKPSRARRRADPPSGGCFVRRGKGYFAAMKLDASPKFDRKSPSSRSKKTNGVERKTVRRPKILKSKDWYERAALSMAIKR
jgi:hypothetical protein